MVKYGVEVECCVNTDIIQNLEKDGYHGHNTIYVADGFWKSESDGSLNGGDFDNYDTYEFISNTCKDEEELIKALSAFEKFFSKNGKYELNEVLAFNSSTGCHIHFSFDKENFMFQKLSTFNSFMALRNYFFSEIEKSTILNSTAKASIKGRYFRPYAKKLTKDNFKSRGDRRAEFNFESENRGTGLEWRSVNLTSITTWVEFREMFSIIIRSINFFKENRHKFSDKRLCRLTDDMFVTMIEKENPLVELNINVVKANNNNPIIVKRSEIIIGKQEQIVIEGLEFV